MKTFHVTLEQHLFYLFRELNKFVSLGEVQNKHLPSSVGKEIWNLWKQNAVLNYESDCGLLSKH